MLRYQEGSDSTTQREQGFLDAIARFPTIKVVSGNQYGGRITKRVDTGATLIRKDEIDQPRAKELLFPDYRRWLKE